MTETCPYWITGIHLAYRHILQRDGWGASITVYPRGSTWPLPNRLSILTTARTIREAVSRMVAVMKVERVDFGCRPDMIPALYVPGDGQGAELASWPDDWRKQVRIAAARLGYETYTGEEG